MSRTQLSPYRPEKKIRDPKRENKGGIRHREFEQALEEEEAERREIDIEILEDAYHEVGDAVYYWDGIDDDFIESEEAKAERERIALEIEALRQKRK